MLKVIIPIIPDCITPTFLLSDTIILLNCTQQIKNTSLGLRFPYKVHSQRGWDERSPDSYNILFLLQNAVVRNSVNFSQFRVPMHNWLGTLVPINHCWVAVLIPCYARHDDQPLVNCIKWNDKINFLRNIDSLRHLLRFHFSVSDYKTSTLVCLTSFYHSH